MVNRNPDIAFTRNPVVFNDSSAGEHPVEFSVSVGGLKVYGGHYMRPAVIDVAEIAESFVNPLPSPEGTAVDEYGILLQLEDADEFGKRLVSVNDADGLPLMASFFALPGGVSPQNYRRLKELDSDIFAARLLDKRRNFFLTTRTHGWRIIVDELEVFPLAFVCMHNEDAKIKLRAVGTELETPELDIVRGVYAIDLNAVRRYIAVELGFLASAFDVYYDGYLACQIVIRRTSPERNSTIVKFRNSLGVFELLHLSGDRQSGAAMDSDGQDWKRYDPMTGRFVMAALRKSIKIGIDIDTGYKTEDAIRHILDMAASDEVYLKDRTGWVRAVPSIEEKKMKDPQTQPSSIKVSLTVADEYDSITPDIKDLKDFERPRIFSDQHTDEFN